MACSITEAKNGYQKEETDQIYEVFLYVVMHYIRIEYVNYVVILTNIVGTYTWQSSTDSRAATCGVARRSSSIIIHTLCLIIMMMIIIPEATTFVVLPTHEYASDRPIEIHLIHH